MGLDKNQILGVRQEREINTNMCFNKRNVDVDWIATELSRLDMEYEIGGFCHRKIC